MLNRLLSVSLSQRVKNVALPWNKETQPAGASASRNLNIDLAKIIAMLSVVGLHTTEGLSFFNSIIYAAFGIAIPMFFTVSGYLMLGRKNIDYKYVGKKILSIIKYIVLTVVTFELLTFLFFEIILGYREHSLMMLCENILYHVVFSVCQKGTFGVYWYFGAIMLLYLVLPFINKLYSKRNLFLTIVGVLFFVELIVFCLNMTIGFEVKIPQPLRLWNWMFYFMLGGAVRLVNYKNINRNLILAGALTALAVYLVAYRHMLVLDCLPSTCCEFWYSSPMVIMYVLGVFLWVCGFEGANRGFWRWIILILSPLFLPVFSYHNKIIYYIGWIFPVGPWQFVGVALLSIVLGKILTKTPVVKEMFKI